MSWVKVNVQGMIELFYLGLSVLKLCSLWHVNVVLRWVLFNTLKSTTWRGKKLLSSEVVYEGKLFIDDGD